MIQNPFDNFGLLHFLGDVSAFVVEITPEDIANSAAFHAFNLTGSSGCKVRWGDGTQTAWTSNGLYSHTYASAGTYTVQILGSHANFNHYSASSLTTPLKVVKALRLYSGLTSCANMFRGCGNAKFVLNSRFKIGGSVTDCSNMFNLCSGSLFNLPDGFTIPNSVQTCFEMFRGCSGNAFTLPSGFTLGTAVFTAQNMFLGCSGSAFTLPAGFTCDISSLTTCIQMFYGCSGNAFTLPSGFTLGANVVYTNSMFMNCSGSAFTIPAGFTIPNKVLTCAYMFYGCSGSAFALPDSFVVGSGVTDISNMFRNATHFNSTCVSAWNVSTVTNMSYLFSGCSSFNQNLENWNVANVTNAGNMFTSSALSSANYDAILNGWAVQTVKSNVTFGVGTTKYTSAGTSARNTLVNTYGWIITDGGLAA